MAFKPGIIPTIVALSGILLTGYLCAWQLNRHAEKQAKKDEILAALEMPAVTAEGLEGAEPFQKIAVQGTWRAEQVLTAGRTPLVTQPIQLPLAGYGVIQAFELEDGRILMVDRGWIPRDTAAEVLKEVNAGPQETPLEGQLRPLDGDPAAKALTSREGLPEIWPPGSWINIWKQLPEPKVDGVVLAGKPLLAGEGARPDAFPIGDYKPLPKMRDSLSYAGQWALFGTVLFIVWLAFGFSRGRAATRG